jgi:hypothetical protein
VKARMTQRGPKRSKPLDASTMTTVTCRLPAWLILRLDEETARRARETGVSTLNRSDLLRALLEAALAPR